MAWRDTGNGEGGDLFDGNRRRAEDERREKPPPDRPSIATAAVGVVQHCTHDAGPVADGAGADAGEEGDKDDMPGGGR